MLIPGPKGWAASIAWVLPITLLTVVLGILLLVGMFLGNERQVYVLQAAQSVRETIKNLRGPSDQKETG